MIIRNSLSPGPQRVIAPPLPAPAQTPKVQPAAGEDLNLERGEIAIIGKALIATRGEQHTAASHLGISPRVLNYKLKAMNARALIDIGRIARVNETMAYESLADFLRTRRLQDGTR